MTTAIVLGGGATRGSFQVGALRYLWDNGVQLEAGDIVVGASVGAINGLKLAEGSLARNGDPVGELDAMWKSLRRATEIFREQPWFTALRSHGAQLAMVFESVKALLVMPKVGRSLKAAWKRASKARSMYSLRPLDAVLREFVRVRNVRNSGIKLRLAMVELERGVLRFVTESGRFLDDPNGGSVNLVEGALASAAVPGVFPDVNLLGRHFVDAGVRENVPIDVAIHGGANRVIAIIPAEAGVEPIDATMRHGEKPPPFVRISQRSLEIALDEIQANDIQPKASWGSAEVLVIQPTLLVHSRMTVVQGLIRINMDYGFMRASEVLRAAKNLAGSSDDITRDRIKAYHGEVSLGPPPRRPSKALALPRFLKEMRLYYEQARAALPLVRAAKRRIHAALENRRGLQGEVPSHADNWWRTWEHHEKSRIIATPWEALQRGTTILVPAEAPPLEPRL